MLQSVEPEYEMQLDEEMVMHFLFENLENEQHAIARVEFGLEQMEMVDSATSALTTTRLDSYRPSCTTLREVIREMALRLWAELRELGCYVNGRLAYSPVTQINNLECWRLSMRPLLLYNEQAVRESVQVSQQGAMLRWS
jgi:hypothetical protein